MSRIYRSLPPRGTKLGIAFSGGLDTRCAVAWLSRQGMQVYAYTADQGCAHALDLAERDGQGDARAAARRGRGPAARLLGEAKKG